jgi:2,5-diamino-6-(ribosylamino)-4(3H)-pyrimidinone 5'-phosphate reductase
MLPRVIIHNGVSVDGRMDWFNGDLGLYYALAGQLGAEAILAGSQTMLVGLDTAIEEMASIETSETLHEKVEDERGLLVVVDSQGQLVKLHHLKATTYWRDTIVLCSMATPAEYLNYLKQHKFDIIQVGEQKVDLWAALKKLREDYGIQVIRVDSGGILNGVLLREGLVDEMSLMITPTLVGGKTPRSFFVAPDLASAEDVISLKLNHVETVEGGNVWLRYEVIK